MKIKDLTDQELFLRLIKSRSGTTYWKIVSALRSRPSDFVFSKCIELIDSEIIKEKIAGIDVLAQLGVKERPFYKETIELFFDLIKKEKDSKLLSSTLIAISHNNDKLKQKQIEIISSFKSHRSSNVRYGVVLSLLGLNNSKAIETLIALSNDKKESVRDWATFGLGTQIDIDNDFIRNALWNRVNDNDQDTKLEAIVGLAKRKDFRIKEIIKRELTDGEFGTLLFEAIEVLNAKEFIPLLRTNLEKGRIDNGIESDWLSDLEELITELEKQ